MIFKVIIARSNPQCIRKIKCNDGLTITEFAGVLSIAFGFRISKFTDVDGAGLTKGNGDTVSIFVKGEIYRLTFEKYPEVIIILESLENDEPEGEARVTLLDTNGYMAVDYLESVAEMNEAFYRWDNNFAVYNQSKRMWTKGTQYMPQLEKLNNMMERYLDNDLQIRSINKRFSIPFTYLMKAKSLYELENLCMAEGYALPSYATRQQCERILENNLCTVNFFRGYLSSCPLREYEALKELCFMEEADAGRERKLFSRLVYLCSMFLADADRKWICCDLLDYLEEIFETEGDRLLLTRKRTCMVISGCCRLYGAVSGTTVSRMYEYLFAEKKTPEELVKVWETCRDFVGCGNIELYANELFWDRECLTIGQAVETEREQREINRYVPDVIELEDIGIHGVAFKEPYQRRLVDEFLQMFSSRYEAIGAAYDTAKYVHMGMNSSEVVQAMYDQFHFNRAFLAKIKVIVEEGRKTVRQIGLYGFSEEECR